MWCESALAPQQPPAERPSWERVRCRKCGTLQYRTMPGEMQIATLYAEAWSEDNESAAIGSTVAMAARKIVGKLAGDLPGDALVLDYGAGSGVLSAELGRRFPGRTFAFEPFGPERDIPGVHWFSTEQSAWTEQKYARIFLSEVIEHLPDPTATLRGLRGLLSPGGLVVVTTPNARGLLARLKGGAWREAQNPAHLILFTEQSLDACARRAGFGGFRRSRFYVPYKQTRLASLALAAAQFAGLDGGLRGVIFGGEQSA